MGDLAEQRVEVDGDGPGLRRRGVLHEVGDDVADAVCLVGDELPGAAGVVVAGPLPHELGPTGDDGQGVVQLVGGAGGHLPHRRQDALFSQRFLRARQGLGGAGEFLAEAQLGASRLDLREHGRQGLGQVVERAARADLAAGAGGIDDPADPGRRPFGALSLDLDLAPVPEISLVVRNLYDVHERAWTQTNYDLSARVSRVDLGVGYHYTRDIVEEVNLTVKADLTRTIRLEYTLQNNLRDDVKVENYVQATYHRQCWSIGLGYEKKEDDQRVTLLFSLYGLGQTGVR